MLSIAAPAHAERVTKLFPLSGAMPRPLRNAPAELTRVVEKAFAAELAPTSIEDAADLIGCSIQQQSCLATIAEKVGADTIIFGRIDRRDDGMVVKISVFDPRKGEQQRSFTIEGSTADALAESLATGIEESRKPKPKAEDDPPIQPKEMPAAPTQSDDDAGGKITTGTWGLIIGGGVAFAGGAGFLFSANSLRAEINKAPRNTLADIQHVQDLENAGRTRVKIGVGLLVVGGAVATVGIVRAVLQKRAPSREQPLVDVVPENGGASILFTVGWP